MMVVPGDPNETVYYYHADSQGTIIGLTNTSGAWVEKYAYTLYGKPAAASTIGNPYMYTGRRLDAETGLYYYRARYYDPHLRRFIETDPIGYAGGMNMYAYVGNSPLNYIDPWGLARYYVFYHVYSGSGKMAGMTIIEGTVVSTQANPDRRTYNAINFRGVFGGLAYSAMSLSFTCNNHEYFEDDKYIADVKNIEGLSWMFSGTAAFWQWGMSGGGYVFGGLSGTNENPSFDVQGFDLSVVHMLGYIKTTGEIYQMDSSIFPPSSTYYPFDLNAEDYERWFQNLPSN